jgi:hypothetical protein
VGQTDMRQALAVVKFVTINWLNNRWTIDSKGPDLDHMAVGLPLHTYTLVATDNVITDSTQIQVQILIVL